MNDCKKCKHCVINEVSKCLLLKTHTSELKKPDLGKALKGCKFEKKEKAECVTINGSDTQTE